MGVKLAKPINYRSVANIVASDFENIMNSLKVHKNFAVAVSGGPDSLALVFFQKKNTHQIQCVFPFSFYGDFATVMSCMGPRAITLSVGRASWRRPFFPQQKNPKKTGM